MPKIITNLQGTRVNSKNKSDNNNSSGVKPISELLSGLKAEHIPLPDTQCIKRVLENSRRAKSKKNDDPPRPPNAFFLFRHALHSHLAARNLKVPQISMAAGELWSAASEEIKSQYAKLQEIAKVLHLEMHPGYVYRPRKTFSPTPPSNPSHTSPSSIKKSNLEKEEISSERTYSSLLNTSVTFSSSPDPSSYSSSSSISSISEPYSPTNFITSRLTHLSLTKHNRAEKSQLKLPPLIKPNFSSTPVHYNNNLYENDQNQRLTGFHQIFTNNNISQTPEIFSQQQQFTPTHLIRPVQNHHQQNIRYQDINRHNNHFSHNQHHHQFTAQQQQNQMDPVLTTTLTSITALPVVNIPHINDPSNMTFVNHHTPNLNSGSQNNMGMSSVIANEFTSQPIVNVPNHCYYRYNSFNLGGNQGNEDWINWDYL